MIIEFRGQKLVAEALAKGIVIRTFPPQYIKYLNEGKLKFRRFRGLWPPTLKDKLSSVAINDVFDPTRYDVLNFFFQIVLIVFGKWIGPRGKKARKRLYCSEAVATWWNLAYFIEVFEDPEATNPLDIDINSYFLDLYR